MQTVYQSMTRVLTDRLEVYRTLGGHDDPSKIRIQRNGKVLEANWQITIRRIVTVTHEGKSVQIAHITKVEGAKQFRLQSNEYVILPEFLSEAT